MIVNKYQGTCVICGTSLGSGAGFVFKDDNEKWTSVCAGVECIKRACPEELSSYNQFMTKLREDEQNYDKIAVQRSIDAKLFDYQIEGVKWITKQSSCLLADHMGLGKSATLLISLDEKYGTLIISPSHLKLNWVDEAKRWRPDLKTSLIKDGKEFRYPEPGEIVITTYGLLPFWLDVPEGKRKNNNITQEEKDVMSNTVLVFDEVQELKSSKTIKSKRARELMKIAYKTIGLTGTPIMNRELELWNMCRAIGIEIKIFENFPRFLYLFGGRKGRYGYTFSGPRSDTPKVLQKAILRRTKEDVSIQLPDKTYVEIQVELPDKIKRTLDNAWDVYKASEHFDNDELPSFEELSKEKELLAISKIEALKQIVDDFESKDIVPIVFSAHQKPVDELAKRKGWKCIKGTGLTPAQKHKIKQEFQDGKLSGLAATIKAAGTGLTLTRTNYVIFNDLDWVPANNEQAEYRVLRIGQEKNKVFIYHLVADHPLDRHIRKLILKKMSLAHAALDKKPSTEEEIKTSPSELETEEDFSNRVKEVMEKEKNMQRKAILSRLKHWPTVDRAIDPDRADVLSKSAELLVLEENDARIVRLLKFAELKEQEELRCLEAVLAPYEKNFPGGFKKVLLRS